MAKGTSLIVALAVVVSVVLSSGCRLLRAEEEPVYEGLAARGGQEVRTLDFPDLKDPARRGRPVPLKLHLPAGEGKYPLVVFSHGGAGNRDAFLFQALHLASRGFAALCVEHVYSNTDRVKVLAYRASGTLKERFDEALLKITLDPRAVLERPGDVGFAIDMAATWDREHPELKGRIDSSKVVVVGHSFGASTVLALCGARLLLDHLDPPPAPPMPARGLAPDMSDARVVAGVAMSPQGPGTSRFSRESYPTLKKPLLCLSGSLDTQFAHDGSLQSARKRLEGFDLMPGGGKFMAWLDDADHMAFADNPKAHLFPSKARRDAQRIARALTLLFVRWQLLGDEEALGRLDGDFVNSLCGDVVTKVTWLSK